MIEEIRPVGDEAAARDPEPFVVDRGQLVATGPAGEKLYGDDKGETEKVYHEMQRPAVIEHPVTGRPILFVNPMHTHGFIGMTREEAWPLIEELAEHATQDL